MNVKTVTESKLLSLSAGTIEDILSSEFEKILYRNVLQQVLITEFPNHFGDFLIIDRLIEQMSFETVSESSLSDSSNTGTHLYIIIQAKRYLQGDVVNKSKMTEELQSVNASAESNKKEDLEEMRQSIRGTKGLQELFKEGDNTVCKVFTLHINTAKEIFSDFRKNKFLDARLLAILENTYIFKTFKPSNLKSIALDSELRK